MPVLISTNMTTTTSATLPVFPALLAETSWKFRLPNFAALISNYIFLGVPCYNKSIMGPKTLF